MPYVSEKQRRYLHAKHPRIAKRWDKETPKGKKLPEKVKKKAAFVKAFVATVHHELAQRGISKEAFARTYMAERLAKLAADISQLAVKTPEQAAEEAASKATAAGARFIGMTGFGDPVNRKILGGGSIAAGLLGGGAGGTVLAKITSPSKQLVENLQREELVSRYDAAIADVRRRIEASRMRGM